MTDALPTGGGGFDWADDVAAEHAASGHDAAVLEAEKEKARKRAERFGQEYKEPKANAIARGLMSRKEVLAMRKEAALKKMNRRGEFVAGIDVFDPAEQAKRAARAAKFGTAAPSALTPEQQAIKDKRDAQDAQRLAANAAALQEAYADAMDDGTTRGAADGAIIGSHRIRRSSPGFLRAPSRPRTRRLMARRRRPPLRRGPHDHRGMRRVLFRVRPGVLRVDQRQQLQRGVQRRNHRAKSHSHEGRRDGSGGEPGRGTGAARRDVRGDAVARRPGVSQGQPGDPAVIQARHRGGYQTRRKNQEPIPLARGERRRTRQAQTRRRRRRRRQAPSLRLRR